MLYLRIGSVAYTDETSGDQFSQLSKCSTAKSKCSNGYCLCYQPANVRSQIFGTCASMCEEVKFDTSSFDCKTDDEFYLYVPYRLYGQHTGRVDKLAMSLLPVMDQKALNKKISSLDRKFVDKHSITDDAKDKRYGCEVYHCKLLPKDKSGLFDAKLVCTTRVEVEGKKFQYIIKDEKFAKISSTTWST